MNSPNLSKEEGLRLFGDFVDEAKRFIEVEDYKIDEEQHKINELKRERKILIDKLQYEKE
jgi:hypothetical protein